MKYKITLVILFASIVIVLLAFALPIDESIAERKPYAIGDRGPAGGWIFYERKNSSGAWRYLEAAPVDQGVGAWGCHGKSIPGAGGTDIGTGKNNTQAIVEACGEKDTAAKLAAHYRGGGESDWFLPSADELNLVYSTLRGKGIGGCIADYYWSSSEGDDSYALLQHFKDGLPYYDLKQYARRVRAIRAF